MTNLFIPLGARVLVRPQKFEDKFEGSMFVRPSQLTEKERDACMVGKIVDIGTNVGNLVSGDVVDFEIGDVVVFQRYHGKRLENPANKEDVYIILNEEDVIAKVTKGESYDF